MTPDRAAGVAVVLLACLQFVACTSPLQRDGEPRSGSAAIPDLPDDATPRREPKSKYGNNPVYEVLGKRYTVLDSSAGYRERGVASWYGKKFHGNLTSNRETYDMYEMTAAHKSLPLPSYVQVKNLRNNKSVVVRVNDRGPFVHNRIIDLSYAAALRLDMVKDGTSLVEVTAISFDEPQGDVPVRRTATPAPPIPVAQSPTAIEADNDVYAQVGAFGSRENADRRLATIRSAGILNSAIEADETTGTTLYRVRIGPIREVVQYDILVEELENLGIMDPYLVTD